MKSKSDQNQMQAILEVTMSNKTTVTLVRHSIVDNPRGIYYGQLPGYPLSPFGIQQAQRTANKFRGKRVAAIFSSPRLRARQTAWMIADVLGLNHIHVSKLLDEVHSYFDGHPIQELVERNWNIYTGIPPPFEQPIDVLARIKKFLSSIRMQYAGSHVVAITHGDPIAFALLWANGSPIAAGIKPDPYPEPASISTFCFEGDRANGLPSYAT